MRAILSFVSVAISLAACSPIADAQPPHFLARERRCVEVAVGQPCREVGVVVERDYDVELEDGIMNVPVIAIFSPGPFTSVMERTKDVQERTELAFDLLQAGGTLWVDDDEGNPAVYVRGPFYHWLRIITLYEEDANAFGRANGDRDLLARYIAAQIDAHYTLFWKVSPSISDYEDLIISETREGLIYKEILLRANEYSDKLYPTVTFPQLSRNDRIEILEDSLWRISLPQRKRLTLLGHIIPRDWRSVRRNWP